MPYPATQVAGAQWDVDLVLVVRECRVVVGIPVQPVLVRVRLRHQVVQRVAFQVGAGNHAQAAVLRGGVGQVEHQERLDRDRGVAHRVVPEAAILVPEQRRAVRRLADHPPVAELRVAKPEPSQCLQDRGMGDELGEHRVALDERRIHQDHAAGSHLLGEVLLILLRQTGIAGLPQALQECLVQHVAKDGEPVTIELSAFRADRLHRHESIMPPRQRSPQPRQPKQPRRIERRRAARLPCPVRGPEGAGRHAAAGAGYRLARCTESKVFAAGAGRVERAPSGQVISSWSSSAPSGKPKWTRLGSPDRKPLELRISRT